MMQITPLRTLTTTTHAYIYTPWVESAAAASPSLRTGLCRFVSFRANVNRECLFRARHAARGMMLNGRRHRGARLRDARRTAEGESTCTLLLPLVWILM